MRMTWPALPLALAALGLAACGGDDTSKSGDGAYPAAARAAFTAACERSSGGKQDACKCALAKLEDTLSYEDFKQADAAIRAGKQPDKGATEKIKDAIGSCR